MSCRILPGSWNYVIYLLCYLTELNRKKKQTPLEKQQSLNSSILILKEHLMNKAWGIEKGEIQYKNKQNECTFITA